VRGRRAAPAGAAARRGARRRSPATYSCSRPVSSSPSSCASRALALPLARPALATVAILEFVARWNDFFWPFLILTDEHKYTAQLGLAQFFQGERTQWALVMAVAVIISLPVLLVFLVGQRFLVDGAATRRER
jgi:multiple sugar transport system permease protein